MSGKKESIPDLIVITGPTATGKTRLAALVAHSLGGEVISADSRQVYRGMDIGTGKDSGDYLVGGKEVPRHLIDIRDAGDHYSVFDFQNDFNQVFRQVTGQGKTPVLCGGTGMYVEAAIGGYQLVRVPKNPDLRQQLYAMQMDELATLLASMRPLHNVSDISDKDRLVRAIEIETYNRTMRPKKKEHPAFRAHVFGLHFERRQLRERITARLKKRLEEGLVDEIHRLMDQGLSPQQLMYYGLEYRYLTRYALQEISHEDMFRQLNTAIHQFAKRQMTWFRRMERKGFRIIWIDGQLPSEQQLEMVLACIK